MRDRRSRKSLRGRSRSRRSRRHFRRCSSPSSSFDRMYTEFDRVACLGDGRCLFRAVAVHTHGAQERHPLVTRSVAEYASSHRDELQPFCTDVDAFVRNIPNEWGGEEVLSMLPRIYGRVVTVFDCVHKRVLDYGDTHVHSKRPPNIYLAWSGTHYDALVIRE